MWFPLWDILWCISLLPCGDGDPGEQRQWWCAVIQCAQTHPLPNTYYVGPCLVDHVMQALEQYQPDDYVTRTPAQISHTVSDFALALVDVATYCGPYSMLLYKILGRLPSDKISISLHAGPSGS